MERKCKIVTGEVYHVFSKSIAGFRIFNNNAEFVRMKEMLMYYRIEGVACRFSRFLELERTKEEGFGKHFSVISQCKKQIVQIIAFCIMPTHVHFILKQLEDNGISISMGNIFNSYTRYFNIKYKRKGPLWEGKFKNVLIETDEQLLHLTRYIHLNPTTAYLVNKPEEWNASSYGEYIREVKDEYKICSYKKLLDIEPVAYKKFVADRISYQRELSKIKKLLLE